MNGKCKIRISLAPKPQKHYGSGVKGVVQCVIIVLCLGAMVSCGKKEGGVVEVTETRPYVPADKINEHFVPENWQRTGATIPGNQMRERIENYQFGETGEIYTSKVGGTELANLNRWLGQFGLEGKKSLEEFETVEFSHGTGQYLELYGEFEGRKQNWGMVAALLRYQDAVLSVKMLGKADEVKAQVANFKAFCQNYNEYKGGKDVEK